MVAMGTGGGAQVMFAFTHTHTTPTPTPTRTYAQLSMCSLTIESLLLQESVCYYWQVVPVQSRNMVVFQQPQQMAVSVGMRSVCVSRVCMTRLQNVFRYERTCSVSGSS